MKSERTYKIETEGKRGEKREKDKEREREK